MNKTVIASIIVFSLLFTACGKDSAHYTKEDVIEKCGFSEAAYDETELVGIKCIEVGSFRSKEKTEYDGLYFYIFDSEAAFFSNLTPLCSCLWSWPHKDFRRHV